MAENKNRETVKKPEGGVKEKTVKLRLPRSKAEQDDVFVSVNHRTWLIKRGETVEVPECVAEVLKHQEKVLEEIMLFEGANKKPD